MWGKLQRLIFKEWQSMDIHQNYFEFLGLPLSYTVDQTELTRRYRELQRELHPDRYAHLSEREQRMAVQYTAYLNEAYSSLKSPLGRAQYLLSLQGVDTLSESRVQLDPMFLMEQMELREALDEAQEASDPEEALEELEGQAQATVTSLADEFALLWPALQSSEEADFTEAEKLVRKLQFAVKFHKEIERLLNELD
jgi:molecular chaperone HscB